MEEEITVSTELKHADFSQQSIRRTLDELHSKASSVLLLTLQWKDLEQHFVRMRDSILSGDREVQSLQASLDVTQESTNSRLREVEAKEKELERIMESVDERFCLIERAEESAREVDKVRVELEGKLRELGEKERFLQATSEAIEERRRAIEMIERNVDERMREFEVKEKELEECLLKFDREKKSFEERVRGFGLKQERVEEQSRVHEQKEKQFAKRIEEFESKEKKFEERCEDLELKEKQFEQRCKAFKANLEGIGDSKSKKRKFSDTQHCKGEIESPGPCNEDRNSVDGSMNASLHFCVTTDGKALQIFLNERWKEHDVIRSEVFVALQMSSNPAKLVLDAMQGFYPPHLKKEDSEFEGSVVMQSCILLLEQLMKISPPIESNLKKEATKLAFDWVAKIRVDAYHFLQVLGFLLLLASYELASAFDSDELLSYLKIVAQHSQAPELLSALGLADKIHGGTNLCHLKMVQPTPCYSHSDSTLAPSFPTSQPEHNYFPVKVDGKGLRMILSEHENDDLTHGKVYVVLQHSEDPAKLVLDAVKGEGFKLGVSKEHCILLLEQLMKFSPLIEPHVKEEALKFVSSWKEIF